MKEDIRQDNKNGMISIPDFITSQIHNYHSYIYQYEYGCINITVQLHLNIRPPSRKPFTFNKTLFNKIKLQSKELTAFGPSPKSSPTILTYPIFRWTGTFHGKRVVEEIPHWGNCSYVASDYVNNRTLSPARSHASFCPQP